jgi:signal transduction histidine kinase
MNVHEELAQPSFKRRVTLTLVGVAIATALIVGAIGYWVNESTEHNVWRAVLNTQLIYYFDHDQSNRNSHPASVKGLTTYVYRRGGRWPMQAPTVLKGLNPGIHDEFTLHDHAVCVLVKDVGRRRIYVVYDIAGLKNREFDADVGGLAIVIALVIGVFFVGAWATRRLVAPVESLAARIQALEPSARGERIGRSYRDLEMTTIANAFDRYLERLDGFIVREQEFTDIASHELRTPVTIISGALDILQNLPDMPINAKRPLERARRATVNMRQTVSTLLDLARETASDTPTSMAFRLDDLVHEVLDDHRYLLEGKAVRLRVVQLEPAEMNAPVRLVYITVANLIRNAMQHTAKGAVTVSLKDKILTIENTASGVADGVRQRDANPARGHGLGLYITERLCRQFGWRFGLRELAAGGTCAELDFDENTAATPMTRSTLQAGQPLAS